ATDCPIHESRASGSNAQGSKNVGKSVCALVAGRLVVAFFDGFISLVAGHHGVIDGIDDINRVEDAVHATTAIGVGLGHGVADGLRGATRIGGRVGQSADHIGDPFANALDHLFRVDDGLARFRGDDAVLLSDVHAGLYGRLFDLVGGFDDIREEV